MNLVNERLLAELNAKDDLILKISDTLDVKANILLVVITFLATQTAYFFDKHLCGIPFALQWIAAVCLIAAAASTILGLWPYTYLLPYPEVITTARIAELEKFYKEAGPAEPIENNILSELTRNEIQWTNTRIKANEGKNAKKSLWLNLAFYIIVGAILLNVTTLIVTTHLF